MKPRLSIKLVTPFANGVLVFHIGAMEHRLRLGRIHPFWGIEFGPLIANVHPFGAGEYQLVSGIGRDHVLNRLANLEPEAYRVQRQTKHQLVAYGEQCQPRKLNFYSETYFLRTGFHVPQQFAMPNEFRKK